MSDERSNQDANARARVPTAKNIALRRKNMVKTADYRALPNLNEEELAILAKEEVTIHIMEENLRWMAARFPGWALFANFGEGTVQQVGDLLDLAGGGNSQPVQEMEKEKAKPRGNSQVVDEKKPVLGGNYEPVEEEEGDNSVLNGMARRWTKGVVGRRRQKMLRRQQEAQSRIATYARQLDNWLRRPEVIATAGLTCCGMPSSR
ncbi:hypothetical protein J4E91_000717 [Alternaria rosae]|nr:hypothetical protein J4E91_000717 [Alternaria rosae]